MWLNPDGEQPVRLAVTLANDPPTTVAELAQLLDEHDLEVPSPTTEDLASVFTLTAEWLTVVDATSDTDRAAALNLLLARYASYPRLTDHRGDGWHLHFREDAATTGRTVAVIVTVGTALHLVNRGMHRLGRCAAEGCDRAWADFSRPGTQRYCSARCANTSTARRHRARHH